MSDLSDAALGHLRDIADRPDFGSTRYEISAEIGRGGMGTVYLAHDRELERTVAIKVVHAHAVDRESAERLRGEARILARLEHPGIVPVYDAGLLDDGRAFYAMKHVAGRTLDDFAREPHDESERLRVFGRICEAVSAAHAQGVLHRDLKPENVRVGPFGEVLVLDFGVAEWLSAARDGVGTIAGTPGYMSPEQRRGTAEALDVRSDVYALGATLRFLLSTTTEDARWRARDDVPRFVPRPLEAIGRRALAEVKDDRYASVPALLDDVHRYLAQLPVSAYRERLAARLARVASRHKTPILLVLAYLAMRFALFFFRSS
jgi:serine/threonine protein kinase